MKILLRNMTLLLALGAGLSGMPGAYAENLYQENSFRALTADQKAHRSGDLITVMIYENASATSTANTTSGRDANVGLDLIGTGKRAAVAAGANNQLDGRGRTQRQGQVLAQITVPIKRVLDNGDFLLEGEHLLEVNNEKQQIKLQGRVRAADISDTNTVLSTRIAEAKISYIGEGDVSEKQRPSWWQRALTWFGL